MIWDLFSCDRCVPFQWVISESMDKDSKKKQNTAPRFISEPFNPQHILHVSTVHISEINLEAAAEDRQRQVKLKGLCVHYLSDLRLWNPSFFPEKVL